MYKHPIKASTIPPSFLPVNFSSPSATAINNVKIGCEGCQTDAETGLLIFKPTRKSSWPESTENPHKIANGSVPLALLLPLPLPLLLLFSVGAWKP